MKNKGNIVINLCVSLIVSSALTAKEMNENQRHTGKIAEGINSSPTISVLNINNHAYWIGKDGAYTTGSNNGTQADYPKFTGGLIYADGMLWGAKVKNDGQGGTTEVGEVRVGESTYGHGLKAGRVIKDADGNVLGSDDPDNNHVWRVRKDWETGNLTEDAANYFGVDVGSVTSSQVDEVKAQYEYDWDSCMGCSL